MTDEQKRVILQAIAQAKTTSHAWDAVNSILSTHAASAPTPSVEPVAWAVFSTNGYAKYVTTDKDEADKWIKDWSDVRPLYAAPLANPSDKQEAVAWPVPLSIETNYEVGQTVELIFESDEDAETFSRLYSVHMGDKQEPVSLHDQIAQANDEFHRPLPTSANPSDKQESVALPKRGYFVYDPDARSPDFYDTDAERDAAHREAIKDYRDEALFDGEWSPSVDSIVSGIVTHKTVEIDVCGDNCDYAPAPAAPIAQSAEQYRIDAEPKVRYCPSCGSIGPFESKYRDCCPDGSDARMVPEKFAEKCRDTFHLAIDSIRDRAND